MSREPLVDTKGTVGSQQRWVWRIQLGGFLIGPVISFLMFIVDSVTGMGSVFGVGLLFGLAPILAGLVLHTLVAYQQERTNQRSIVAMIPLLAGIVFMRMLLFLVLYGLGSWISALLYFAF